MRKILSKQYLLRCTKNHNHSLHTYIKMDTQFLTFVELFGVTLTTSNVQIYKDLYEHFNTFQQINPLHSFEKRFILWKNHCDRQSTINNQQAISTEVIVNQPEINPNQQAISTEVIVNQPEMIVNNYHLPHELQKIVNDTSNTSTFNTFSLKPKTQTNTPTVEIITESHNVTYDMVDQTLEELAQNQNEAAETIIQLGDYTENNVITDITDITDIVMPDAPSTSTATPAHHGKNINILKACYDETQNIKPNETETFTTKRKRKRTTKPVLGSGRPTNNQALIKLADDNEEDDPLACKELLLLSSAGEIRKKTTIFTTHTADIKCYAIKHYTSLCHVAEQRKEALEIIKKQRTLLDQLSYIEACILPLVRPNNNIL